MAKYETMLVTSSALDEEASAALIGKFKGATSGLVIGIYGVMRSIFAAFNVGFGGVAGFVRPVIMPMAEGAIVAQGYDVNYGARPLKRWIQQKVETLLARKIIAEDLAPNTMLTVDYDGNKLIVR